MGEANVTTYLLDRLAEAGVERLFGVPGDFTLAMLDDVEEHPTIEWVGCANELGAGYAADGYARIRGLGAVCTTFGVGELSAINAIAGAYAEHVPVIHVVGSPSTATQAAGRATHHTLGDGDFGHFARMAAEVTHAQGLLTVENAAAEIDRVIRETLTERRPGYLLIPADVAKASLPAPDAPLALEDEASDAASLAALRGAAAAAITDASSVSLLAGILVHRMGAEAALHDLLALGVPHAVSLWGRRVVDESSAHYVGPYIGAVSSPEALAAVEDVDVLITVGVQFTDLMSGFFSQHLPETTIEIGPRSVRMGDEVFGSVAMSDALAVLGEVLEEGGLVGDAPDADAAGAGGGAADPVEAAEVAPRAAASRLPVVEVTAEAAEPADAPLDQAALWDAVAARLREGDLVIADQGTSFYGMGMHRMPHGVTFIGQPLWAAIGYTLPALLGAALADRSRRPIVLIGDGAAQLTIAELGTLIRDHVPAIVVVVNNLGYTVERAIHGLTAEYNDIAPWNWTAVVKAFDPTGFTRSVTARTAADVTGAFEQYDRLGGRRLVFIEAVVPPLDVPPLLSALAEQASRANARRDD
ncbi:indolepyruvate decarboxylase [Agromyces ramosus]|uniref:Alpha-keto-acid decarboxylase n=1 Tax=Agromyces ramosus TaxID=33879 RepID=A0A4Q7MNM4_9MICO|nr:thiamine pyrophosphate-binding protein [Agromyces ramosus]RZS68382.1 indolepyruvate decarboxylase [Agromyces ramosus]